jgi:predicted nucleic acid-binding protein
VAVTAAHDEVLLFIEEQRLMSDGLGFVDVHLLASARLSGAPLWTHDKKLKAAASRLRVCFENA